jgi:xanthine dehydrogenase molybdopterin-binding subunit B
MEKVMIFSGKASDPELQKQINEWLKANTDNIMVIEYQMSTCFGEKVGEAKAVFCTIAIFYDEEAAQEEEVVQ